MSIPANFLTAAKVPGRRSVNILEIDVPKCSRVYGVGACTGSLGAGLECYNCLGTCQVLSAFNGTGTLTLRFATSRVDNFQTTGDPPTFPTLASLDLAPTRLEPNKSLGWRSSLKAVITDIPYSDVGLDPYVANRTWDPMVRGNMWQKLVRRVQYWENREVRLLTGFFTAETDNVVRANCIIRRYILSKLSGPDANGAVTIEAVDPLRSADSSKIMIPPAGTVVADSNGVDCLVVPQTRAKQRVYNTDNNSWETPESVEVDDLEVMLSETPGTNGAHINQAVVFTVGDYIRVGEETMYVEAINTETHVGEDLALPPSIPGFTEDHHNALTVTRDELPAEYPTGNTDAAVAVQHSKDAGVQICKWWDEKNIVDIVIEILHDYVGIDNAFIDLTGMAALKVEWLSTYVLSALVTQPTSAKQLLEELCQLGLLIWWDEDDQKIKMDIVKPIATSIPVVDDDSTIVADSFSCTQDSSMRYSQIWLKFAQRNPALDFSKENMAACQISADLDAETTDAYGGSQLMVIESRWIPYTGWTLAKKITSKMLYMYHNPPIIVDIRIDQKDASIKVGSLIRFSSEQLLDADGAIDPQLMLVLEKEEDFTSNGGVRLLAMTLGYDPDTRYGLISDASTIGNYTAESAANQAKYVFISDAATGKMSNGDAGYMIAG